VTPPEFLNADAVRFLHDQSLREHGGQHGPGDEGLLASALARPENRLAYAGEDADLFDLAAAYALVSVWKLVG
jgi:death-on-curing protein